MKYAGFWIRFVALFIDGIVLFLMVMLIGVVLNLVIGSGLDSVGVDILVLTGQVTGFLLFALYFALMESSSKQGSVGKIVLGIKVVDTGGLKIGFGKAFWRSIVRMLTLRFWPILLVSVVMMFVLKGRKTLHDKLAGTAVVGK